MEAKRTKQLVALIIVIGAATGITVGAIVLLTPGLTPNPYELPGAPDGVPLDRTIKVGVLGDTTAITGIHSWRGAYLAAREISELGGIEINGSTYYIGLRGENTFEAEPLFDVTKATTATERLLRHNPDVIIGGFRTEVLTSYLELIMDEQIPFIGTGSAADEFTENVVDEYARYKYFFRAMPLNSTALGTEAVTFLGFLNHTYGIDQIALIYEDLDWTTPIVNSLQTFLPALGFNITTSIAFPADAAPTQFPIYWGQIEASGAQLALPIISATGGVYLAATYGVVQPDCIIAGINVPAQLPSHWNNTEGNCEYEITVQSTYRTNKTNVTVDFWDAYVEEYGDEPLYTGVGSRDAIYLVKHAVETGQSLGADNIVAALKTLNETSPLEAAAGYIAFGPDHDVIRSPSPATPLTSALFVQWQAGGEKVVVPNPGVYPMDWVTGNIEFPPWLTWI